MSSTTRFAVSLDEFMLSDFDELLKKEGYPSRSEAIRDLITNRLSGQNNEEKPQAVGTLTMLFDSTDPQIIKRLIQEQLSAQGLILSTIQTFITPEASLEVWVVKGSEKELQFLTNRLENLEGILHSGSCITSLHNPKDHYE